MKDYMDEIKKQAEQGFILDKIGENYREYFHVKNPTQRRTVADADPTQTFKPEMHGDDGFVQGTSDVYSTAHATATYSYDTTYILAIGQNLSGGSYRVYRAFLKFNTSTIPLGATITAASLKLYGDADNSATDFYVRLQKWTGDTPIDLGDYNQFDGQNYDDGAFNTANFQIGQFNTITISDFNLITKAGYTKICVRSSRDITETPPTGDEYIQAYAYEEGLNYCPQLVVTWTEAVSAPTCRTDAATNVMEDEATLNGTVINDGGEACSVRFQYGTTVAYGTNTPWQTGKRTGDSVSQLITGLAETTTYHFRVQVKNSAGTCNGSDQTFTTLTRPTPFIKRVMRDVFGEGADINAGNPLDVQDTGVNTNPRRYETDNAFRSQVLTLTDGNPHILWSLNTTPARTEDESTFIYVITVFSRFGNTVGEVGLEQPVGTELYPRVAVNPEETAVVTLETPIPVGATGVFARAHRGTTVVGVDVQILGLEV